MIKDQSFALISLLISLLLMAFLALPVSAADMPDAALAAQTVQSVSVVQTDTALIASDADNDIVADESASADAENPAPDAEDGIQEEKPAAKKNSNAPFLTGAVIAVLAFIGVAIFCKVKGNK